MSMRTENRPALSVTPTESAGCRWAEEDATHEEAIRLRLAFAEVSPRDWDAMSRGGSLAPLVYDAITEEASPAQEDRQFFWLNALDEEHPSDSSVRGFVRGALAGGVPSAVSKARSRAEAAGEEWAGYVATGDELMRLGERFDRASPGDWDGSSHDGRLGGLVHDTILDQEDSDPDDRETFWESALGKCRPADRSVKCFVRGALDVYRMFDTRR